MAVGPTVGAGLGLPAGAGEDALHPSRRASTNTAAALVWVTRRAGRAKARRVAVLLSDRKIGRSLLSWLTQIAHESVFYHRSVTVTNAA